MSSGATIGSQALKQIADIWQLDAAKSTWGDNGFDWWPGHFRVCVRAHRRQNGDGLETWWVTILTDFLRDVPISDSRVVALVAASSRFLTSTYAWAYQPVKVWDLYGKSGTSPRLWLSSNGYVTAENVNWLPAFLARMSIMQPINAQVQSHGMAETLGCKLGSGPIKYLADQVID